MLEKGGVENYVCFVFFFNIFFLTMEVKLFHEQGHVDLEVFLQTCIYFYRANLELIIFAFPGDKLKQQG